jgi:hypothetical protein
MRKIILAVLVLGVAFFNLTNASFNADKAELSLFQLKMAQACDGEEGEEEEEHCVDYCDDDGNDFPTDGDDCTDNCINDDHDNSLIEVLLGAEERVIWVDGSRTVTNPLTGATTTYPVRVRDCPSGHNWC